MQASMMLHASCKEAYAQKGVNVVEQVNRRFEILD
jgi:hypothetical protein